MKARATASPTLRCQVMGILNVTPDSFSDGGLYDTADKAVVHAVDMAEQGAAIIDVGAESTRPGADPVSAQQQMARAIPVIERLSREIQARISIDTTDVQVAEAALDAGATMINDITALGSEGMVELAARYGVPVILMHMQGAPATMQRDPVYQDVVQQVKDFLLRRAQKAEQAGIAKERIWIDPGIGFGKTLKHNLALLRHVRAFVDTGYQVLVGASRKRLIRDVTGRADMQERIFGTTAIVAHCVSQGVSMVRVHDAGPAMDTIRMIEAITQYA